MPPARTCSQPRSRRPGTLRTSRHGAWKDRRCGRCPLQRRLCWFSCWIVSCGDWLEGRDYIKRFSGRLLFARLLPTLDERLAIQVSEVHTIATERCLSLGEPTPEALPSDPQRILGVDLQSPGHRDNCEQQVAHLIERALGIARVGQLAGFLGDVLGCLRRRFEIKSHPRGALLQPQRPG